jgi:hypothetical protein
MSKLASMSVSGQFPFECESPSIERVCRRKESNRSPFSIGQHGASHWWGVDDSVRTSLEWCETGAWNAFFGMYEAGGAVLL